MCKIISLIVIILLIIGLSGCTTTTTNNEINLDSRFIGTWQGGLGGPTFIFYLDGTCSYMYGALVSWEIKNGNLVCEADGYTNAFSFIFFNNNNVLELHHISNLDITYKLDRI